jgi:RHS repeat-associated protein
MLPVTPAALQGWLDNAPANGSNPKAYVNWILLDEQMKPVTGASGFDAVGATDELKLHAQTVNIPKNGYLYVYVSNQSDQDVFFDNLQVVHARGPLLEETHYYPFGLTMAGISSKAAGKLENKKEKFQGQELDDELGLNWYGFKWRNHDPQIGRFIEIDPLTNDYTYNSPYAFAENKLGRGVELEGLELGPFPWMVFESNPIITRGPVLENVLKTGAEAGTKGPSRGLSPEVQQSMSRGRATEVEQLGRNGLDKNTKPIEVIDPKTGKSGTTVPDALKNEGQSTVEIKDVKTQGLTRQLRLQEKYSNDNGFKPELIINEGAKLSKPLQNSTFDIKTYSATPAVDATFLKAPVTRDKIVKPQPAPIKPDPSNPKWL